MKSAIALNARGSMAQDLVLVNARSGSGTGLEVLDALNNSAKDLSLDVFPLSTDPQSEGLRHLAKAQRLFVAGGDGSLHSLLPHLRDFKGTIGLLPLGTCNDLGRHLGIRRASSGNARELLTKLRHSGTSILQVWTLTIGGKNALFANYASWGFDSKILHGVEGWRNARQGVKRWQTKLQYALRSFQALFHYKKISLTIRTSSSIHTRQLASCLCANIPTVMGWGTSNRLSDPSDDLIEVLLLSHPFGFAQMILCQGALSSPLQANSVEFELTPNDGVTQFQLDGEPYQFPLTSKFDIKPAFKLHFFSPKISQDGSA